MKQGLGSKQELEQQHTDDAIAARLAASTKQSYLGDFLLGAIDGAVTTFAIVASVAGAGLKSEFALVLGLANLLADGFSMAAGNYLKTKSDHEVLAKMRHIEERHIALIPEGEKEELRQIYAQKGFERGPLLEKIITVITADKKRWVDEMLVEEWGMDIHPPSPWISALITMLAFCALGAIPLIPFLFYLGKPLPTDIFMWSAAATGLAFFLVGSGKGKVVAQGWLRGGLETLFVGSLAAGLAYAVGYFAKGLIS